MDKKIPNKIALIALAITLVVIGIVGANYTPSSPASVSKQSVQETKNISESKQKKQKIVGDAFALAKDALNNSAGTLAEINKHRTIPRSPDVYNTFKEVEDYFMKASVSFSNLSSSVDDDMGTSKDELKQALDALTTTSVAYQNYFKNMADYVNTGNLESQRKANQELDKEPSTIMTQAINQIIKVAGEVGMDSDAMKKEISDTLNKINNQ